MFSTRAPWLALLIAACGSPAPSPPAPAPAPVVADAGAADAAELPAGEGTGDNPRPATKRPTRPIEIVLRSSPVPARVSVDGAALGNTPQVWLGETGAEHEFAFQAPGYALTRFRFTPVASGVLHPRLERIVDDIDAGVPPPPEVVPPQRPAPVTVDVDAQPAPIAPAPLERVVIDAAPAPPVGPQP
ncbi:MAG: PEGA domain-containing protein [Myxococcales bacterium]|nr:PEGA domain-containing protein [Myxococcales bacterium]